MNEIVQSKYADVDRDDAAMRLRRGEWTPADAKAWSNAHPNERPFESVPSHDRFDPMRKPEWTLAMAAAWIIWGTADEVREHWDAYLLECMELRVKERIFGDGRKEVGWESLQRDPVSLSDIVRKCGRADPEGSKLKALANIECLWNSLKEGQLEATGVSHFVEGRRRDVALVAPRRMPIPRPEWIDLSPVYSYDGMPNSVGTAMDFEPRYDDVRVWRDDMLRLPPCKSPLEKRTGLEPTDRETRPTRKGLPPMRAKIREISKALWPNGTHPARVADRDNSIRAEFINRGESQPSPKTIQRAFKDEFPDNSGQ